MDASQLQNKSQLLDDQQNWNKFDILRFIFRFKMFNLPSFKMYMDYNDYILTSMF